MNMIDFIRQMEGQPDVRRREILLEHLASHRWNFQLQEYAYAGQAGCNVIVDINTEMPPTILLSAHYDSFQGSPGANDDASAIAVLIDAAEKLQLESLEHHVRLVFFDDEEPTEFWNEPLGMQIYVEEYGVQDLYALLDFELVGMGDAVGIWPIAGVEDRPLLRQLKNYLEQINVPHDFGYVIPAFYGDYLPFRKAGFLDSYCFTSFHWKDRTLLKKFAEGHLHHLTFRYALSEFLRLPTIPKIFRHYHSRRDRAEFLSTNTLEMMSNLVYRLVRNMNYPPPK